MIRKIILTGGTSFLARNLTKMLHAENIDVIEMGRQNSGNGNTFIRWSLGETVELPATEAEALIHCAWDMKEIDAKKVERINVQGSISLFESAIKNGVKKIIFISTISAFEETKSVYGKTKLDVEKWVLAHGGIVIRPGLIWGAGAERNMFTSLSRIATKFPVLPIPGDGASPLYLCHIDDLVSQIRKALGAPWPREGRLMTLAHPRRYSLLELMVLLSGRKRMIKVKIPWRLILLGLQTIETLGLRLGFKSDSLLSLIFGNRAPVFDADTQAFRSFHPGSI